MTDAEIVHGQQLFQTRVTARWTQLEADLLLAGLRGQA